MGKSIRAFSSSNYDYYVLTQDLGGIVPKGAIFYHDPDDDIRGSVSDGCLKLCWTPDGSTYRGKNGSVCGGAVIFNTTFIYTDMFVKVTNSSMVNNEYKLKELIDELKQCIYNIEVYLNDK